MANEWTNANDMMPEDDKRLSFYEEGQLKFVSVLAYEKGYGIYIVNRLKVDRTGNEYMDKLATDGWVWQGIHNPTHWMPLPDIPKQQIEQKPTYVDRCICCGEIIPEGRQICVACERKS